MRPRCACTLAYRTVPLDSHTALWKTSCSRTALDERRSKRMARARVSTVGETCERVVIDAGVLPAHLKTSGRWSYSTCVPHAESRHLVAAQQGTVLRLSTPCTASSVMRTATTKMADTKRHYSSQTTKTRPNAGVRKGTHRARGPPATASSPWRCPAAPKGSSPASHRHAHTCAAQSVSRRYVNSGSACAPQCRFQ